MKNWILSCLLFAIVVAIIPLAAIGTPNSQPIQTLPVGNVDTPRAPVRNGQTELPEEPALQIPSKEESEPPAQEPETKAAKGKAEETEAGRVVSVSSPDSFQILNESTGKVMTVSVRDYVRGALAAELPPTFHAEALKAQAIAAHSYAVYMTAQRERVPLPELKGAQLTADPENWKSYTTEKVFRARYGELADAYWQTICEAADEVNGYLLVYEGEPVAAAYHSMSAGVTEDAANVWTTSVPYLIPVESKGDPLAPDFESTVAISAEKLRGALAKACPDALLGNDPGDWLEVEERSEGGYALLVRVGDQSLTGIEMRTLLGLRSSNFDVDWDGESVIFTVRGYGHGVGLSQYGADYLARQGMNFEEILQHYYPETTLAARR